MVKLACPCCDYGTHDAAPRAGREEAEERTGFARVRIAERQYGRALRSVARHVGDILRGRNPLDAADMAAVEEHLTRWASILGPWARTVAAAMLTDVQRRDRMAWRHHTLSMGRAIREEVQNAPTGRQAQVLMDEQVGLITSIPLDAAQRIHRLSREGLAGGMRPRELREEIMRSSDVSRGRADLIARTEVGRAATTFLQARAQSVGSEGYIWRTANDRTVRPSHARMRGQFVRWDEPPELDGMTGHAGALPNCRCRCSPVLPD